MTDMTVSDGFFPRGAPQRERYLLALCEEGLRIGRMSEAEDAAVRGALMELLGERILLFTDGESTSVREETAQRILASIVYNISIALLREGSHAAALDKLRGSRLGALHDAGTVITVRTHKQAQLLILLLRRNLRPETSAGLQRFILRDAYSYIRDYDPLYGSAAELWVQIDELSVRESVCGIMRLTEIMAQAARRK